MPRILQVWQPGFTTGNVQVKLGQKPKDPRPGLMWQETIFPNEHRLRDTTGATLPNDLMIRRLPEAHHKVFIGAAKDVGKLQIAVTSSRHAHKFGRSSDRWRTPLVERKHCTSLHQHLHQEHPKEHPRTTFCNFNWPTDTDFVYLAVERNLIFDCFRQSFHSGACNTWTAPGTGCSPLQSTSWPATKRHNQPCMLKKGSKESGNTSIATHVSKMKLDHPTLTVRWNLPLWSLCLMILDALEHRQPPIFSIGATYLDRNQCKVINIENVSCPTGCWGGSTNRQTNADMYSICNEIWVALCLNAYKR